MNQTEIESLRQRWAAENREREERYAAFASALDLRPLGYGRARKHEEALSRGSTIDHAKYWGLKGDRRTVVLTVEPYTNVPTARSLMEDAGFETMALPDIALHYPECMVLLGVHGRPGLLAELIAMAQAVPGIRREARDAA